MPERQKVEEFERMIVPHFPAAYNLARWLTRRAADAEDVVQESFVRAFKSFDNYRGGNARAWTLAIVRNTCYTWLKRNRLNEPEELSETDAQGPADGPGADPGAGLARSADHKLLARMLEGIPPEFREVIVLRELEGLSYKEIVEATGLPLGTVMSRLSRGRDRLQEAASRIGPLEGDRDL